MNKPNIKFQRTETLLLHLLPLTAFLGLAVPLILGYRNLVILGSYLALPMIIAPVIYLRVRKDSQTISEYGNRNIQCLLICCFLFFFTISIFALCAYETRTILYYLAVTLMSVSVLLQILLFRISKKTALIILVQIMMLILDIIGGGKSKLPLLYRKNRYIRAFLEDR
jgi:cytochrome bd-type quinol oxidase subunit 2